MKIHIVSYRLYLLASIALMLASCSPPGSSTKLEVASRSVQSGALSHNGQHAVIGSVLHGGSLWDVSAGERLYHWNHTEGNKTVILRTAFSPDNLWATTADEHTLVLWNVQTGKSESFWRIPAEVLSIALARHGNVALLGLDDGSAAFYNVRAGGIFNSLPHSNRVNSVAVSEDSHLSATGDEDGHAKFWESNTTKLISERIYNEPVQLVALSRDGKHAFVSAKYDRMEIVNTATGDTVWLLPFLPERMLRGVNITAARFSSDGLYLLTGRPDGFVELWDIAQQTKVYQWQLPKRKKWQPTAAAVMSVSFTEDTNRYMAISSDGNVHTLEY